MRHCNAIARRLLLLRFTLPRFALLWCIALWAVCLGRAEAQSLDEARRLVAAGDAEAASAMFLRVAAESTDLGDQATGYNNACVLLGRLGNHDEALKACQQALPLRRRQGDPRRLARALNNTALALQYLGRYEAAIVHYHEALEINRQRGDWHSVVINLSNLSLLKSTMGRHDEASDDVRAAIGLTREHAETDWADGQRAVARINYGVILEQVGAYREALDLYDEILLDSPGLAAARRAQLEVNRGVLLRQLGDPVRAVAAFEQAIDVFAELKDLSGQSNGWLNLGLVRYLNLGQPEAAEQAFRQALRLARQGGDAGEELQDLYFLGRLLVDQGRLQDGAEVIARSRELAAAGGSSQGLRLAAEGAARLARAQGRLDVAQDAFDRALDLIETTRSRITHDAWRAGYFADRREVYVAALETSVEVALANPTAAAQERTWELLQRSKERQLLDALATDDAVGRRWEKSTLDELKAALGDGAMLELFVATTRLYGWSLTAGELRLHDLGRAAPVVSAARRLHEALAAGQEPPAEDVAELSSTLLAGSGVLSGDPEYLVVVADGDLRQLPFEMLTREGRQVVELLPVSYLPSASLLVPLRRRRVAAPAAPDGLRLLALGSPTLAAPQDGIAAPADLLRRRFRLPPLPAALKEVAVIEKRLGGETKVLVAEDATERAFRAWAPSARGVVHLATHALVADGPGGGSAIVLTPEGSDDGLLMPGEILELPLEAPLTVLASCRSGLAGSTGNSALSTLSGAFLAAGSSAVVASLWSVDDQATRVFMEQFYFQLSQGLEPARALRQSKLRLRRDERWNRPWIWGAFVLIGDAPPVVERPWGRAWRWGVAALAALLIAGVVFRRRRL